jgi:nitrate reductase gamma subunit
VSFLKSLKIIKIDIWTEGGTVRTLIEWLIAGPFVYVACLGFVLTAVYKVIGFLKMPRHLRWDLYPIAHEPQGSHHQKVDFGKLPKEKSLKGELSFMLPEMLLLVKMFKFNQPMWIYSFPMHFGLYLLMGWIGIIGVSALTEIAGVYVTSAAHSIWPLFLYYTALALGAGGLILGLFGTAGLLIKRFTDEDLKDFSSPITYFNLILLLGIFGVGFLAWLFVDPTFNIARGYTVSLLTFNPMPLTSPLMMLEVFLVGSFLLYLPHSRMFHFAAKYFFYHNIMWDDEAVERGSKLENSILGYLNYKTEWSAKHIVPNETWLTQAVTNPADGGEKRETQG